ncbi:hypothetical protein PJI16_08200 [Nitrospira sp. MA-1]|nr:hypothetical protein [Nitrospira sp. MA-1]
MSLSAIEQSMRNALKGTELVFNAQTTGCMAVDSLLGLLLSDRSLNLQGVELLPSLTQLIVKGRGSFYKFTNARIEVIFTQESQGLTVRLSAIPPTTVPLLKGLDALTDVLGKRMVSELPTPLQRPPGLSLNTIILTSGSEEVARSSMRMTVGTTASWSIWPSQVSLDNIVLEFEVYSPSDPQHRQTGISIHAASTIAGAHFTTFVRPPSLTVFGGLRDGETLALAKVLQIFLPSVSLALPTNLVISKCFIRADAGTRQIELVADLTGKWPITLGAASVTLRELGFQLELDTQSPNESTVVLNGRTEVAGQPIALGASYSRTDGWGFTTRLPDITLSKMLAPFLPKAVLPQTLSTLGLTNAVLSTQMKTGFLSLRTGLTGQWIIPLGDQTLTIKKMALRVERQRNNAPVSATFWGQAILGTLIFDVRSELLAKNISFTGSIVSLSLSSILRQFLKAVSLPADLPIDIEFSDLHASVSPSTGAFSFSGQSTETWTIPLGIGQLTITGLSLQVDRSTTGTDKKQAGTTCRVEGQGKLTLSIDGFSANFAGSVEFVASPTQVSFTFYAKGPHGNTLKLPIPTGISTIKPQAVFTFDELAINHTQDGWQIMADATTQFTGLPSFLTAKIPGTTLSLVPQKPRKWTLSAGRGEVAFSTTRLWDNPLPPTALPTLKINGNTVSLGVFWLDVRDWKIRFGKGSTTEPKLALQATIDVAVSDEINRVFGVGRNGLPWLKFFKTAKRNQKNPLSTATGLQLSLSEKGISAQLQGSPINVMQPDEQGLYHITLGPNGLFGELSCPLPTFRYNGLGWTAAGEFHIEKPLQLPLTPLREALTQAGLGPMAELIPKAIPLDDIALVKNNRLTFDPWLAKLQEKSPSLRIPPVVIDALNELVSLGDAILERTPGQLNEYLAFVMPQDLSFAIEVSGTGGMKLDVTTRTQANPNPQPLKLLLPFAGPPFGLPELLGIQLTSLSFGQILSGSLFLLQLEGKFDRFDLLALAGCLTTGYLIDGKTSCKAFQYSYTIDQLLAVLPAGSPVPVPLFYKELAISYFGWEMLKAESRWSFPQPDGGLFALIGLFSQLLPFFTKATYKLDPEVAPKGFKLPFMIGPNYLQLPPYLGGAILGTKTGLPTWSVWKSLANLLNGFKTGSPQDFVNALPVEARVGEEGVVFGPFSIEVGFAVTTPREFKNEILPGKVRTKPGQKFGQRIRAMRTGPDKQITALLPKPTKGPPNSDGLIILLVGTFEIHNIITLQSAFGLAAIDSKVSGKGFGTGVQFTGTLGNAFTMKIAGAITVTSTLLSIKGSTGIWWKNRLMTGVDLLTVVDKKGFFTQLTFNVTPKCSIAGTWTISKTAMSIGGDITWDYGGNGPFTAGGLIAFSKNGLTLTTTQIKGAALHGVTIQKLTAIFPATGGPLTATIDLTIPQELRTALRGEIQKVSHEARDALNNARQLTTTALDALKGHELSLNGVKAMLVAICNQVIKTINARIKKLPQKKTYGKWPFSKTVYIRAEATKEVAPYLQTLSAFSKRFNKSTKATLAADVTALVNWALKNKTHTVSRYGFKIKTITILATGTVNQLNDVKKHVPQWIARLPEKNIGLTVNGKILQYAKNSVDAALNDIATSLEKGEENVPMVTGISVGTTLSVLPSSGVKVLIQVTRGNRSKTYPASFSFTNPAAGASDLLKLLLKDLGTSL